MARPLRLIFSNGVYHVTARGNARQAIVRDDRDRARFVDTLAQMVEQYRVLCHSWVLMSNHYHLLLETPEPNLSLAVRHLNGVYTQAFNRRHRRVGHLFQGRFKAIVVEREAYLLELCRYVVLNPVRAGLVTYPRAYAWSSYRATAGETAGPQWLTVDWVLQQFGSTRKAAQQAYQEFVKEGLHSADSPWERLVGQLYLGSESFIQKAQRSTQRLGDREIPRRQREPALLSPEEVLRRVARAYGSKVPELVSFSRRPTEARQVALYGLRRQAGLGLKAIGERMELEYPAVSRRVSAVAQRLEKDRRFRQRVEQILSAQVKT